jgi:uncharacterized repeat protein (TIGR01451 family)
MLMKSWSLSTVYPKPVEGFGRSWLAGVLAATLAGPVAAAPSPTLTAAFNPTSIAQGQTSTLTFTITNPAGSSAVSGLDFAGRLPAGVVLAARPQLSQCGGSVAGRAGSGTFSLAGGAIGTSPGTCDVTLLVTATVLSTYQERPSNIDWLSNMTDAGLAADLDVVPGGSPTTVSIWKSAPTTVDSGQQLTYTITYGDTAGATDVVIRDTIPPGTSFVSATDGGLQQGPDVAWYIPSVPAGPPNNTVSFTVAVTAIGGTVLNGNYGLVETWDGIDTVYAGSVLVATSVTRSSEVSIPALGASGLGVLALALSSLGVLVVRSRAS